MTEHLKVKIIDGPFKGFIGKYVGPRGNFKHKIIITMFGKEEAIIIDALEFKKLRPENSFI